MGKNSKRNEKHTWTTLVATALFLFPCALPKNPQNSLLYFLSRLPFFCLSLLLFPLSETLQCVLPSFFSFVLPFFLYLYSPLKTQSAEGNPLSFLPFPFLSEIRISIPFIWRTFSSHLCNHINPLFPPKIFFLPSLSAPALVRVDQQPPILLSNDKK